jgi:hypothetical protein
MSSSSPDGTAATGTANIACHWQVTFDVTLHQAETRLVIPGLGDSPEREISVYGGRENDSCWIRCGPGAGSCCSPTTGPICNSTPNDLVVGGKLNSHLFLTSALDGDDFQLYTATLLLPEKSLRHPMARRRVKLRLLEPAEVKRGVHPCRPRNQITNTWKLVSL